CRMLEAPPPIAHDEFRKPAEVTRSAALRRHDRVLVLLHFDRVLGPVIVVDAGLEPGVLVRGDARRLEDRPVAAVSEVVVAHGVWDRGDAVPAPTAVAALPLAHRSNG